MLRRLLSVVCKTRYPIPTSGSRRLAHRYTYSIACCVSLSASSGLPRSEPIVDPGSALEKQRSSLGRESPTAELTVIAVFVLA
ncbi:hypothetical protein H9Q74_011231 [Fusarium xylarioides]|nr:hypothetical protein H9Q74_011231 [Fusarium xylarioides]